MLCRIVACTLLWLLAAQAGQTAPLLLDRAEVARLDPPASAGAPVWAPVRLPHGWEESFPAYSGIVGYRARFDAPADGGLLGVYLPRVCTNADVALNGEPIGSGGDMQGPVTRNCYHPQLYSLPRTLLRPQGNELLVRIAGFSAQSVSARQRAAGLSEVQVGTLAELEPLYQRQLFWNVTMAQIIATTIGLLGATMLGLAAMRRQDTYLMYFGLFSTGWALISTRLFMQHVPLSNLATEILICSAFPPVLGCAYLFLLRLVGVRARWVDSVLATQVLAVPLLLVIAGPQHLLPAASAVYNLLAVEFLAAVAVFFTVAWRARRSEFWLMSLVLVIAIVLAGAEIALQNDWLPLPKIHVIHFAMPFLFVVIAVRLVQLFVRALTQAETANQELEQRVAEKSGEIERSYAQLTVLRTEQAAQGERQRIASDLHDDLGAKLLTIAQVSLQTDDRERIASMARQALEEMRLSVRGLTANPAHAGDVVADWRAETVGRMSSTTMHFEWHAQEPDAALILPARTHVQLTRVLREALSNTIRHSQGRRCRVHIAFEVDAIALEVEDDGRGLPSSVFASAPGHGLPSIEQRVRKLGGHHRFSRGPWGGTLLSVRVPLARA